MPTAGHILDSHTIALWRFDEPSGSTATDLVSSKVVTFSTASFVAGVLGNAISCPGNSSGIGPFDAAAGVAFLGDFTIEVWINPSISGGGTFKDIVAYGRTWSGSGGRYIVLSLSAGNGHIGWGWSVGGMEEGALSTISVTPGVWQHVAIRRTGTTVDLFYNGVFSQSWPSVTMPSVVGSPYWNIGAIEGGALDQFSGLIDDMRISNIARSNNAIALSYRGGPPAFSPHSGPVSGGTILNVIPSVGGLLDLTACQDSLAPYIPERWTASGTVGDGGTGTVLSALGAVESKLLAVTSVGDCDINVNLEVGSLVGITPSSECVLGSFGLVVDTNSYVRVALVLDMANGIRIRLRSKLNTIDIVDQYSNCVTKVVKFRITRIGSSIWCYVNGSLFASFSWSSTLAYSECRTISAAATFTYDSLFDSFIDAPMFIVGKDLLAQNISAVTKGAWSVQTTQAPYATQLQARIHMCNLDVDMDDSYTYLPADELLLLTTAYGQLSIVNDNKLRQSHSDPLGLV